MHAANWSWGRRRRQQQQQQPRLERKNALRYVDYDAASYDASSSSAPDSPWEGGGDRRRGSSARPSSAASESRSFRISGGCQFELQILYETLGVSGPEDFAIPLDEWLAAKQRSSGLVDEDPEEAPAERNFSFRVAPEADEDQCSPTLSANPSIASDSIGVNRLQFDDVLAHSHLPSANGGRELGIRGVRPGVLAVPPPVISPPPLMGFPAAEDAQSFASEDEQEERSKPATCATREQESRLEDLRLGDWSEDFTGTSSLATTIDDETCSVAAEALFMVSPNGRFRKPIRSWSRGVCLGFGSFGTVYEGISEEGYFFAVKEVCLIDQGSSSAQSVQQLEQEIALLSQFEHENIVQYYGTDKEDTKLFIFLELVTQGSLASLYNKYQLRDSHVSTYTWQILNGLAYLHDRNIVHRDIKCANILVHANGSVKLADFGLAKEATKLNLLKSCKGSVFWMAPEVVKPNMTYGPAADIWSLGCTVLEMLTRQLPYPNMEWMQALLKIGRGEPPPIPDYLSQDARDFISQCVQVDPDSRPSAFQLMQHEFVRRSMPSSSYSSPNSEIHLRMNR